MKTEEVLDEFRKVGALLEGHFILSSGRRSPVFLQKALVFSHPKTTERLCGALARKLEAAFGKIDVVVGPAVGGLIADAIELGARGDDSGSAAIRERVRELVTPFHAPGL